MTVIIAHTTKEECWMSCDSSSVGESSISEVITPKIIKHAGGGLLGSAGSWVLINALAPLAKIKCEPSDVVAVITTIKEGPFTDTLDGCRVLMVWPGRPIVLVQQDTSVLELRASFDAIGSGEDYALGYLEGVEKIGAVEMKRAVEIAAKHSTSVMKPARVIHCVKGESK